MALGDWLSVIGLISKAIKRRREKKMLKGKLTYAGIAALAVGWVSSALGVDIASSEVDAVISAVATLVAIYGRWRATK